MPKFRVERTEMVTRVWIVEAASEDEALEHYFDEEDIEENMHHSGHPTVEIKEVQSD